MQENSGVGAAYRGRAVLVLGAAGFIGRWVARLVSRSGARLALAVREAGEANRIFSQFGVRGEVYAADLTQSSEVEMLYDHVRPSITFNLAGYGVDPSERDERMASRINAELVEMIVDLATRFNDGTWKGQQLVHVGSALEYGSIRGNLAESSIPRPTSFYGRSKLKGTERLMSACARGSLRALTARLFTVYGPGENDGRLLPSILKAARRGEPLALTAGSQKRDFTYVEDVAEGLLRLGFSAAERGAVVNLATGRLTSVRAFSLQAADILGIAPEKLHHGALPTRAEEMDHAAVSVERLRRLVDWCPPTDTRAGILATVAFESEKRARH